MTVTLLRTAVILMTVQPPAAIDIAGQLKPIPLIVEHVELVPPDTATGRPSQISIRVLNPGKQTINSWGVSGTVKFVDGTQQRFGNTVDSYESLARKLSGSAALLAGGRYTLLIDAPKSPLHSPVADISAQPRIVVFEDNSIVGDEREAEFIFRSRATHLRALQAIEATFLDATAGQSDVKGKFHSVDQALNAVDDEEIRQSSVYREVRRAISSGLSLTSKVSPQAILDSLMSDIRLRRAAAAAHAHRR